MKSDYDVIKNFIFGEWCDCSDICRILNISFSQAYPLFDFSREVFWNSDPLNGQKIITKFCIRSDKKWNK